MNARCAIGRSGLHRLGGDRQPAIRSRLILIALMCWSRYAIAVPPGPGQGGSPVSSFLHSLWSGFNELLAFTANLWQNIDGLVFSAVAVYICIRLTKSVLGHDESTIKTSTSFDYLGAFPRESDHKVYRLEEVWKLPFHEKTVRACFRQASEEQPFLCIPNGAVWLALHDFFSGTRNDAVPHATDLRRDYALHRVSHILGITFGNYEMRQARIEDLAAPKLLDILRDPVREFQKAALSSRDLETARQLALIELAAIVCWKAPHLLTDALMEPELNREALWQAPGRTAIEKKLNLEATLQAQHKEEFEFLMKQGKNLGRLFLLDRRASCKWLNSLHNPDGDNAPIPALTPEELAAVERLLQVREKFQPWTHHLVETLRALPFIKKRFPYHEYVQQVGRLEADGWLVRVYVNHAGN